MGISRKKHAPSSVPHNRASAASVMPRMYFPNYDASPQPTSVSHNGLDLHFRYQSPYTILCSILLRSVPGRTSTIED